MTGKIVFTGLGKRDQITPGRWRNKVPLVFASEQTTRFNRSILKHGSSELDTARIDAKLKDDVLTVTIPKTETAKPHRIEVRSG